MHIPRFCQIPPRFKNYANLSKHIFKVFLLSAGGFIILSQRKGALKIKEITYVHAEGIAGGELKHGPLALMDSSTYVIVINPNDDSYVDNTIQCSRDKIT